MQPIRADAASVCLQAFCQALLCQSHAPEGDRLRVGGSLRGTWEPGDRRRLFAGVAAGPDTDLGVVTDTWSLFGGGELPIGARISVVGSLAREWREGPADRTEFRIGLKVGL